MSILSLQVFAEGSCHIFSIQIIYLGHFSVGYDNPVIFLTFTVPVCYSAVVLCLESSYCSRDGRSELVSNQHACWVVCCIEYRWQKLLKELLRLLFGCYDQTIVCKG